MGIQQLLRHPANRRLLPAWARRAGEPLPALEPAFAAFAAHMLQAVWETPELALRAVEHVQRAHQRQLTPVSRAKLTRLRAHALRGVGRGDAAVTEYAAAFEGFLDCHAFEEAGRTSVGYVFALAVIGRAEQALAVARRGRKLLPASDLRSHARLELNLAHAFIFAGRLGEAKRRYTRALERCGRARDDAGVGACLHHLAIIASKRGDYRTALEHFRKANALLERSHLTLAVLYCEAGRALADLALGQWDDGLRSLERLRQRFQQAGDRRAEGLVRREVAAGMSALGVHETARKEALRALQNIRGLGLGADEAYLQCVLGRLLAARGWHAEAHGYLARARRLFLEQRNRWLYHRCGLELARLLVLTGRPRAALPLLESGRRTLERVDRYGDGALCQAVMAEAHLALDRPSRALHMARRARRRARQYPASLHRPGLALVVAHAHSVNGDARAAVRWAHRAVQEQEVLLQQFGSRLLRETVAESRDRIYEQASDLLLRHGGRSAARSAVDLLAKARSAALVEECQPGGAGGMFQRQTQVALARLRDDLLEQPQALDLRLRHKSLQPEIDRLAQRLDREASGASRIVQHATAARAFSSWAPRLSARELVLFDRREDLWRAFVVREGGEVELVALPRLDWALHEHWRPLALTLQAAAAATPARRREFLDRTREDSVQRFAHLADAIWGPISLSARSLVVVPHGALHDLPLEALAAERVDQVTRLPHPALLADGPPADRPRRRSALVLHGATAGTRHEAEGVAALLRQSRFDVELGASRRALEHPRERWGVMHIATHGTLHPEGWLLSGLKLQDGWIGFEALHRPTVQGALLYLSSCDSGRTTRLPGSNLKGWLAAGLGAGARELMLTLWKLDDRTGTTFAREFYGEWIRGRSAASAAATARQALRAREPHPFTWAPFVAVGG